MKYNKETKPSCLKSADQNNNEVMISAFPAASSLENTTLSLSKLDVSLQGENPVRKKAAMYELDILIPVIYNLDMTSPPTAATEIKPSR